VTDNDTNIHPRYATLADLKRREIDLRIETVDENGEPLQLLLPMKTLSFFQVETERAKVVNPMPPVENIQKDASGHPRPVYNYNDPGYQAQISIKNNERMHRVFLAALRQDVFPIPGDTDDEKLDFIKREFDASIIQAVMIQLNMLATEASAAIENRADTFHRNGTAHPADNA